MKLDNFGKHLHGKAVTKLMKLFDEPSSMKTRDLESEFWNRQDQLDKLASTNGFDDNSDWVLAVTSFQHFLNDEFHDRTGQLVCQ